MQRERYFFYSLCAVALLIPFDFKITNALIIVATVLWLLSVRRYFTQGWQAYLPWFLLFASLYLINIPGLIHSDNMSAAVGRLESRLTFLVFPLIVLFSNLDKSHYRKIGYSFCIGLFLTSIYCIVNAMIVYLNTPSVNRSFRQLTYLDLLAPLELHPTYISLFTSFCIFFLIFDWYEFRQTFNRSWLSWPAIIYFTLLNFIIQSRAPLAAFLLISLVTLLGFLLRRKAYKKRLIFALVGAVAGLVWMISGNQSSLDRFNLQLHRIPDLVLQPDTAYQEGASTQSTIYHLRSWYCASKLLQGPHFFTGYGSGDEKDVLQPCYEAHGWKTMAEERMNAHNEYLSSLLRNGIFELSILLAAFLGSLYWAMRHANYVYAIFILLWLCVLIFNTINLQSGMFFYALFNAVLFKITYRNRREQMTS